MSNQGTLSDGQTYTFKYWKSPKLVVISYGNSNDGNVIHSRHRYFDEISGAFPYHPITPEQQAVLDAEARAYRKSENRDAVLRSLHQVSQSVDNPSHWNRLSPEIKSQMQTHYREILKLRGHEDFDGDDYIAPGYREDDIFPPTPEHDVLEDQDSTPHRENAFLLPANTPLKRGDILVRLPTTIDSHTRTHYGDKATTANTLLNQNFDLFLATNGFFNEDGSYVDENDDPVVHDAETFAMASERGYMAGFSIEGVATANDRLCFLPQSDGSLTLELEHPHGWPDCGFNVSSVNDDGTVNFWWDGRAAEQFLRNLADPDVPLLPTLRVADGCMTLITSTKDQVLPELPNNAKFWLRNRALDRVNLITEKVADRATLQGDGNILEVNETAYVTWDATSREFRACKVNDGSIGRNRFKLIQDRSEAGNYQLPTSNTFNLVSWVADWTGGKLVEMFYNDVRIAQFAGVLSGFTFHRIDLSPERWREIGDTLINDRGTVHTRIEADSEIVYTSAFQVGY